MTELANPHPRRFQNLRARLADEFPNAIMRQGAKKRPLAINTREVMMTRCPWLKPFEVRNFLNWYTRKTSYLRAMQASDAMRIDLDGNPVEPVSDDHKKHAAFALQRALEKKARFSQIGAKKKAAASAEASAP